MLNGKVWDGHATAFLRIAGFLVLLGASVPACAEGRSISSDEKIQVGKKIFLSRCRLCHSSDGDGNGSPKSPLGLGRPQVESKTDEELETHIEAGGRKMLPYGSLPGYDEKIPVEQIQELVAYIRTFDRASNAGLPKTADTASLRAGASSYGKSCAFCHGEKGKGLDSAAKSLGVRRSRLDLTAMDLDAMTAGTLAGLLEKGGSKMGRIPRPPSREEIMDLLHYIHALSRKRVFR